LLLFFEGARALPDGGRAGFNFRAAAGRLFSLREGLCDLAHAMTRLGGGRFSDGGNLRLVNGPRSLGATASLLLLSQLKGHAFLFQDLQESRVELKSRGVSNLRRLRDHGGHRNFLLLSRKPARPQSMFLDERAL
jgi:hypothetical protein